MNRAEQIEAFLKAAQLGKYTLTPVSGDASFRSYQRVQAAGKTYVLMDAPPGKEDVRPYIRVAEALLKAGYSAPKILAKDAEQGLLLLEDFGDKLFIADMQNPVLERELYRTAVDVLVEWNQKTIDTLPPYTIDVLKREVALFAEWYIPSVAPVASGSKLAEEFLILWQELFERYPQATTQFVHRDYHVSNLMWLERKGVKAVGQLDFQDALLGAPAYDLVSLLEDARRDVPQSIQTEMLEYYLQKTELPREEFLASYAFLGAQRNFKILGIFVRLWKRDSKPNYLALLPRVWGYVEQDLMHPALAPLKTWIDQNIPAAWRSVTKEAA